MTVPERLMMAVTLIAAGWLLAAVAAQWIRGLGDPWKERGPWPAVLYRQGDHAGHKCQSCRPGGFAPGRQGDFDTEPGMQALTGWRLQAQYDRRIDEQRRRRARWAALRTMSVGSRRTVRG